MMNICAKFHRKLLLFEKSFPTMC